VVRELGSDRQQMNQNIEITHGGFYEQS
jgi:hypothetical protein